MVVPGDWGEEACGLSIQQVFGIKSIRIIGSACHGPKYSHEQVPRAIFAHISVYTNQYLKYQARKGALFDEYQFEIRAEEDPIHGAMPTVLQVSSACGQQVI